MSAQGTGAAGSRAARAGAIDGDAQAVRRRQVLLFSIVAAVALVVVAVWLTAGGGGSGPETARIDAELAGPGTAEDAWTRRSEARIGRIEAQQREMRQEADRLGAENEKLRRRLAGDAANARSVIDTQKAMIDELGREIARRREAANADPFGSGETPGAQPGSAPPAALAPAGPMIERFELEPGGSLPGDPPGSRSGASVTAPFGGGAKPVAAWLPAGSHAQAVVLAGVDASAGISSQGDPRPVLLRLTGPAWTAAPSTGGGRGPGRTALSADIDGCTVTGAAHGDLSSEKVYVRLRTLTCTGSEAGTVIETDVAGFVAGSGKTGVRGPVVSREGALIEKAFLAGLVSGVGQGISQAFQPQAVAAGGAAAVANSGVGDIGRAGLGSGAATAGQKVADYMIRRAEQYQPVIQLRAGTRVTVVFLEGARLDGAPEKPTQQKEN